MLFGLIASVGLALASPLGGGFGADQRARADLHGDRPPFFTLHFEKLVFRNTLQATKLADRHCERVRVCAHRPPPILRTIIIEGRAAIVPTRGPISGRSRLLAGKFWTRHRRHHSAQTRWQNDTAERNFPGGEMWGDVGN